MYLGRVVELGPAKSVFAAPRHPYTRALLHAAPTMEPPPEGVRPSAGQAALIGELPSPLAIPSGCPFHPRCPVARPECTREVPRVHTTYDGHLATCHLLH